MLRLPPFDYIAPPTLEQALELLDTHKTDAMLVAGGTDLFPSMKRGLFTPKVLVGLSQLTELNHFGVRESKGTDDTFMKDGFTIGAGVTLSRLVQDPLIARHYPALAQAAAAISTPQLRHMGTLGGNLCVDTRCTYYNQSEMWRQALGYCLKKEGHVCWVAPGSNHCWAVQSSDIAPVLVALDATVRLSSTADERQVPIHALYQNDGMDFLCKSPGEILVDVQMPSSHLSITGEKVRMAYLKLRRRGAFDFPIVSVAVALHISAENICAEAKIVLGAIASAPLRAVAAEACLRGERVTHERIDAAAELAYQAAKPLDNTDMSLSYRKQMVRVYVTRALRDATGLSQS